MAKVGASVSVNIPLGDNKFDRYTPVFMINDIDTEGDVNAQIEEAIEVGEKVYLALSNFAEKMIKLEVSKDVKLTDK